MSRALDFKCFENSIIYFRINAINNKSLTNKFIIVPFTLTLSAFQIFKEQALPFRYATRSNKNKLSV